MAKPDPALLNPARFPFSCSIETRYRDLDSNMHLNNGVLASLLEEGRVRFHRVSAFGNVSAVPGLSSMVVSAQIDYLGQSHFPEPLEIHVALSRIGSTSYELSQLVMQDDAVVAFALITMVFVKDGRPFAISDDVRADAQPWLLRA